LGRLLRGLGAREARHVTALTVEELRTLLSKADTDEPQYADLLHVLAWSGVRVGEACGLRWEDFDGAGFLDVRRTVTWQRGRVRVGPPKSGRARRVEIPADLVARLERRRSVVQAEAVVGGREPSPWVFPEPADPTRPLSVEYFRIKLWPRLLRLC